MTILFISIAAFAAGFGIACVAFDFKKISVEQNFIDGHYDLVKKMIRLFDEASEKLKYKQSVIDMLTFENAALKQELNKRIDATLKIEGKNGI